MKQIQNEQFSVIALTIGVFEQQFETDTGIADNTRHTANPNSTEVIDLCAFCHNIIVFITKVRSVLVGNWKWRKNIQRFELDCVGFLLFLREPRF